MNCREVRDVVCAFIFDAHHEGRRMHHAEPHENLRDAEPDAAQWPASGPTVPGTTTTLLKRRRRPGRGAADSSCVLTLSFPGQIREWCANHIMWPRTLPYPNDFPRLRSVRLEKVIWTVSLKVVIQGRCGRHIVCPRSTLFPSRVWCGSHVMWPRTRPFPVFALGA